MILNISQCIPGWIPSGNDSFDDQISRLRYIFVRMTEPRIRSFPCPFKNSLLMAPNNGKNYPGVLMLHGSEGGGFPAWKISATQLAGEGYAVLAYSYFGSNDGLVGPRETLTGVEVGDLLDALAWLKSTPQVSGKKVALAGTSRGAELALLAGSLAFRDDKARAPDAIAVHAPANKAWGSWNHDWVDSRCWIGEVPAVQDVLSDLSRFKWNPSCGQDPTKLSEDRKHAWKWRGMPIQDGTLIDVGAINCPVFISQGMKDSVWPASQVLEIEKALKASNVPHETAFYENGDHWLNHDESYDRLCKVLSFYRRTLGE